MNVLVTGGAGYIGSHTCKEMVKHGLRPVVFDNLIYGHRNAVRWGPLEVGELADTEQVEKVLRRHKIAAVIHFAAYAYVGESVHDPAKYYHNNVGGTLSLLAAMRRAGVGGIVFSSTCATYGDPVFTPITEAHPQTPVNPYGQTKLMVEKILADYHRAYNLASISLRYFNAAGADPDGQIGEAHDPETHLIPLTLAASQAGAPLTVYGDDYDTPDGTCVRDYVHVSDLARGHVRALLALGDGGARAYNLGTGTGVSVKEMLASVQRSTGCAVRFRVGERRIGDPAVLVADCSLARAELGWQPQFTDIDTVVGTAWKWLSQQKHPAARTTAVQASKQA